METKQCSRCKEAKFTSDFCKNKNMSDGYQSACKACMNVSYTISRKKKLDHYNEVRKKRGVNQIEKLREWKESLGCMKCHEKDSACLELHHLNPLIKEAPIANVIRFWGHERLQSEISKCIVLCSNCHKKFHAGRFQLNFCPQ